MKIKMLLSLLVLFFTYSLFCLYRSPAISDSLILLSIGALAGFCFYFTRGEMDVKPQVEVPADIKELLSQIDRLRVQKELAVIQYDISKIQVMNVPKGPNNDPKKFVW
jgi:hypothetical protein